MSPGNMPLMASKSTVLPEPVRPRMAKISPIWMVREMGDSVKLPLFTEKLLITSWFIV